MSIKITLRQLINAGSSGALSRYFSLEKPVSVSWKNRKQAAVCEEEVNKNYNDRRIELCKKYGRLDEKTNQYVFTGENLPEDALKNFETDINLLLNEEVEIPGVPVKVSMIQGNIRETDLQFLEPFLTE